MYTPIIMFTYLVVILALLPSSVNANMTTALQEDAAQENITKGSRDFSTEINKIQSIIQMLPLQIAETGSEVCDKHLQFFKENVLNMEHWALRMLDSSSKLPTGVFDGYMLNLGNFVECISISEPEKLFNGKYCLSLLSLAVNKSVYEYLKFVPWGEEKTQYLATDRFSQFGPQLAFCLPSSCTGQDLNNGFNKLLSEKNISATLFANEQHCTIQQSVTYDASDLAAIIIIGIFALLVIMSTVYDVTHRHSVIKNYILTSFSAYTNGKKLLSTKSDDYLRCLHGFRFFSSVWVIIGHIHLFTLLRSSNILRRGDELTRFGRLIVSNSFLSVDGFLLLTGLLLSYTFLKNMKNKRIRDFNIPLFYFQRYLRLTPILAILILMRATIFRYVGSGPMWRTGVHENLQPCRETWWQLLLYIQNYVQKNSCMMESWYLAVDFQLYIISPILLIVLWKKPTIGLIILFLLILIGIVIIFTISYIYEKHLPFIEMIRSFIASTTMVFMEDSELNVAFQTEQLYAKTHTRYPPWVVGFILGYILYESKNKVINLSKLTVIGGWFCSIILMLSSFFVEYPLLQPHYQYNVWECSFYNSVHSVTWAAGVAWMIFACASGYGGPINWILSLKMWIPVSKLTYPMYLVHFTILQLKYMAMRDSRNASDMDSVSTFISIFCTTTVAAFILSLMFESPFIALLNLLFRRIKSQQENQKIDTPNVEDTTQSNA